MRYESTSRDSLEELKRKTLAKIKCCLVSSQDGLSLDQLQNDYEEIIGSSIPFKGLGYSSLASFVQSAPQDIKVTERGGQLYVTDVSSADIVHVQKLVQKQRKAKVTNQLQRQSRIPLRCLRETRIVTQSNGPRSHALPQSNGPRSHTLRTQAGQSVSHYKEFYAGRVLRIRSRSNGNKGAPVAQKQVRIFPSHLWTQQSTHVVSERFDVYNKKNVSRYKLKLLQEVELDGMTEVAYETFQVGMEKRYWLCTIKIDGNRFHSYLEEADTKEKAEESAARRAWRYLLILANPGTTQKLLRY